MDNTRRTAAVIASLAAATTLLGTAPAQSAEVAESRITARASDTTPASGQQLVLRGVLRSEGAGVPDATVRVKTYRDGEWVRLRGAVVSTDDEGRYRVRVTLSMKGDRMLRVVGNPKGDDIRTARKDLTVTVH